MAEVEVGTTEFESPVIARARLVPPRLRPETVDRPVLVERRLASTARLGVIGGPAGSGKSVLLAQCHAADPFAAWLSLERADNDPVKLWWSLIASLRTVVGDFGETYRTRLLSAGVGALDDVVVSVGNELAERATPIHLFLDDAHVVDNVMCGRSLLQFVSALPGGARVTVASRTSAPLPLARLRADGDLVEIGARDLALATSEAHRLMTSLDVSLDEAHLDLLVARTEGWPAGLQLAGLALARADDPESFVEEFQGTDRDVADYLLSEVLGSVSKGERDFMIETSILDRLTGDLCDAVTGRPGSAETLVGLERSNAFVIPLDRDDRWYRYHHLFGELVAAELHRRRSDDERGLHRRAFEWLRGDGQVADAIPHGLAAGETDATADLFCEHWFGLMNSGRLETARLLLAQFRPEYIEGHQPLALAAALAHGMAGEPHAARRFLDAAERATYDRPPPDGSGSMTSALALTRATLALDGIDAALADGRIAHDLEPAGSPWRPLAALDVALALIMRGDVAESTPFLEEAERTGDEGVRVYALAELSLGQLARGDAEGAAMVAARAIAVVRDAGIDELIMAAVAHAAASLAAVQLGDERAARISLRAASPSMGTVDQALPMDRVHARLLLARAAMSLGEIDLARQNLDDARRVADTVADVGAMREDLAELTQRLDALGPGADENSTPEFSDRELEVIALLPSSLTTREIGKELFLSRNTIKTYLRRVYRKLNASSREEAVLLAEGLGLLEDERDRTEIGTTSPG